MKHRYWPGALLCLVLAMAVLCSCSQKPASGQRPAEHGAHDLVLTGASVQEVYLEDPNNALDQDYPSGRFYLLPEGDASLDIQLDPAYDPAQYTLYLPGGEERPLAECKTEDRYGAVCSAGSAQAVLALRENGIQIPLDTAVLFPDEASLDAFTAQFEAVSWVSAEGNSQYTITFLDQDGGESPGSARGAPPRT